MMKLRKFKEKKLTNKNIMISFGIMVLFMIMIVISKSYAIYKLEKKYDLIQSKIGSFTNGDIKVAVLVEGEEHLGIPSFDTNDTVLTVSGQKTTTSSTTSCTNCSANSFNIQNPYISVYMYKRTA